MELHGKYIANEWKSDRSSVNGIEDVSEFLIITGHISKNLFT